MRSGRATTATTSVAVVLVGCLALAAGTAARADLLDGVKAAATVKENLVSALKAFELELDGASEELHRELKISPDFLELNETAKQLDEVFFSRDVDVPLEDLEGISPEVKRIMLNGPPATMGLMGKLGKYVPSEFQAPTYRPIKLLKFFKRSVPAPPALAAISTISTRLTDLFSSPPPPLSFFLSLPSCASRSRYTFQSSCTLRVKVWGDTPILGKRLFDLDCTKPQLTQAFVYQWEITVPIGPLRFPFTLNIQLPDISGFTPLLKIANGDLNGVLELLGF